MRFVASRGAAAKSHREDAAGRGHPDRVVAGCGHRDRAAAGRGVAAELHREATSRAASAEDQATQRGSTEQQAAQGSKEQWATQGSGRRIK